MIADRPSWIRHEGLQIFTIDVEPGGLRFATGGGDHKVYLSFRLSNLSFVSGIRIVCMYVYVYVYVCICVLCVYLCVIICGQNLVMLILTIELN